MSSYLLINILTIIFPLILSADKKLKFYKNIPFLLQSMLFVSTAFIIWDAIAAKRGDWAFNPSHLIGFYIFGLPIEEILFFITVPYSCVFIYETVKLYINEKQFGFSKWLFVMPTLFFAAGALIFYKYNYTFTVFVFTAVFFIAALLFKPVLLISKTFWITILISFLPFFVVNYFLTSIPIVSYNEFTFSGKRFVSIPYEDFLYSFSMISLWILIYDLAKDRKIIK
jgi:lycopene cyclase domain-containing protein